MKKQIIAICLAVAAAIFPVGHSWSDSQRIPAPEGEVILTASGNLTRSTDGEIAELDWAMLEALGFQTVTTTSPWYDEAHIFEGVPARALMEYLGIEAQEVTAIALNDYQASIPAKDFLEKNVLLALSMDGKPLSVRDKGPVFIIYPFDQDESLRNETYFARSVWQLRELKFTGEPTPPNSQGFLAGFSLEYLFVALIVLAFVGIILKRFLRNPTND